VFFVVKTVLFLEAPGVVDVFHREDREDRGGRKKGVMRGRA
jgi:hypothetical protein